MMADSPELIEAREMYSLYIEAEKAVLKNQAYSIRDRTFTRADLRDIASSREYWLRRIKGLTRGGMRIRRVLPRSN